MPSGRSITLIERSVDICKSMNFVFYVLHITTRSCGYHDRLNDETTELFAKVFNNGSSVAAVQHFMRLRYALG